MRFVVLILLISIFSCNKKQFDETELLTAFLKHSYYDYKEEDLKTAIKKGVDELKKLDKNFDIVNLKGRMVKKKDAEKKEVEFFFPFIIKKNYDNYLIVKVFDYTVAFNAGLRNGVLLSLDNRNVRDMDVETIEKTLRKTDEIKISFNDGKGDYSMIIKKEMSAFPFLWSVILDEKTAYLNLISLSKNSANYFKNNVSNLKKRGIKNLIIDLRDVSMGNYDEAARIIGYFSKEKKTYSIRSSKSGYSRSFEIEENPFTDLKIIVLVNKNTLLLGEIIAQALKEEGASVVGENTPGNVYITKLFKVGNNSVATLTIAKLFPPSMRDMDDGISVDYDVKFDEYKKFGLTYVIDYDPVISKAFEIASKI